MSFEIRCLAFVICLVVSDLAQSQDSQKSPDDIVDPQISILSPGVTLTKIAQEPDIVTPTGIDVDTDGNLWVVACHTHFRPDDYKGPEHDEVVKIAPDGTRTVFYNKTDATMDLELGSNGWVYLAERDRVLRVRDTDGDGRGDVEENIAVLETVADYPHNGLSGMAWHPSGDLVFALGENFWKEWTLTARVDGSQVTGSGEGGIFRCKPDGGSLRRIARGFWNPFGICVREDGTMFAAENDPGSRPPCRLLHLVDGGDYGYQRAYGNSSVHPFVCLDGELPGTLPMMHSLGEAPCGIAPLGNGLIVPSWTDHRIDFYPLSADGATFKTQRISLVGGGDQFRPTCIAQHSPSVYYLTDWVIGSYPIHGHGAIWKLEIDLEKAKDWVGPIRLNPPNDAAKLADQLRTGSADFPLKKLLQLTASSDAFIARAAIDALSRGIETWDESIAEGKGDNQVALLLAVRKAMPKSEVWARVFLDMVDTDVKFEALRWISDEKLVGFTEDVRQIMRSRTIDYRIFEACLATSHSLAGKADKGVVDATALFKRLNDGESPARVKAYALRLINPNAKQLNPKLVKRLYETDDQDLLRELTRTLVARGDENAVNLLTEIAQDEGLDFRIRADATAGLPASSETERSVLLNLANSDNQAIREEAIRGVRFANMTDGEKNQIRKIAATYPSSEDLVEAALSAENLKSERPPAHDTQAWKNRLANVEGKVDLEAGRRIFHHSRVGTCWKCHRHEGRGNVVGPDLSRTSNSGDPDRLLIALLQPSKDVDPQYHPRSLLTEDGKTFTGILLRDGGGNNEVYRDANGKERKFKTSEIVQRKELKTSIMPDGLIDLLTDREIRDLLAFLDRDRETLVANQAKKNPFVGEWWLEFEDGYGGWFSFTDNDAGGRMAGKLLWRVGNPRNISKIALVGDELHFYNGGKKRAMSLIASISDDKITIRNRDKDASAENVATGKRIPPMPPAPDLAKIKFGEPIELFNGRDLSGWKLHPQKANNGWSAKNGELINETPKTDFSGYGTFGNLRTERVFGDCKLHIEYNIGTKRNSGIYVRGLYEAQVVDRDSPMQGISGPGAIFGRVAPSKNAGLPGGQWQTYDLTLVDRHMTVVLNGETVIDNQPVVGCTGGSYIGNVSSDGPLYLQGDHTSVRYRNIRLSPRLK